MNATELDRISRDSLVDSLYKHVLLLTPLNERFRLMHAKQPMTRIFFGVLMGLSTAGCPALNKNHCVLHEGTCADGLICSKCAVQNNGCVPAAEPGCPFSESDSSTPSTSSANDSLGSDALSETLGATSLSETSTSTTDDLASPTTEDPTEDLDSQTMTGSESSSEETTGEGETHDETPGSRLWIERLEVPKNGQFIGKGNMVIDIWGVDTGGESHTFFSTNNGTIKVGDGEIFHIQKHHDFYVDNPNTGDYVQVCFKAKEENKVVEGCEHTTFNGETYPAKNGPIWDEYGNLKVGLFYSLTPAP